MKRPKRVLLIFLSLIFVLDAAKPTFSEKQKSTLSFIVDSDQEFYDSLERRRKSWFDQTPTIIRKYVLEKETIEKLNSKGICLDGGYETEELPDYIDDAQCRKNTNPSLLKFFDQQYEIWFLQHVIKQKFGYEVTKTKPKHIPDNQNKAVSLQVLSGEEILESDKNIIRNYLHRNDSVNLSQEEKDNDEKARKLLCELPLSEESKKIITEGKIRMKVELRQKRSFITSMPLNRDNLVNSHSLCQHIRNNTFLWAPRKKGNPHVLQAYLSEIRRFIPDTLSGIRISDPVAFDFDETYCYFDEIAQLKNSELTSEDMYLLLNIYFEPDVAYLDSIFDFLEKYGIEFPENLIDIDTLISTYMFDPIVLDEIDQVYCDRMTLKKRIETTNNYPPLNPYTKKMMTADQYNLKVDEQKRQEIFDFLEKLGPFFEKFRTNLLKSYRGIYINEFGQVNAGRGIPKPANPV